MGGAGGGTGTVQEERVDDGETEAEGAAAGGLKGALNDIDTCLEVADAAGAWSEEFLQRVHETAKKALLRTQLAAGYLDEDGNLVRSLSVEEIDPATGEVRRGYKQLEFFSLDNYEYAIRDVKRRIGAENRKLRMLCRMACERYGSEKVQQRFDWKLPLPKGKAAGV